MKRAIQIRKRTSSEILDSNAAEQINPEHVPEKTSLEKVEKEHITIKQLPKSSVKSAVKSSIDLRAAALEILKTQLGPHFEESSLVELETHIHSATVQQMKLLGIKDQQDIRFYHAYNTQLTRVCLNLNPESYLRNTYLLTAVKEGAVNLCKIPYMSIMDINPKAWDKQIKSNIAEMRHVAEGPSNIATTNLIKCGKCGSGVRYVETQTRSPDEPMTIRAECVKCGNKFNC
jgi:DNA-directed RNA polymerase subunit M/transcription elongation factor TFIIS